MKKVADRKEWLHMAYILMGVTLYAVSYSFFLIPGGLYSGGFTGVSQIIKWIIEDVCRIPLPAHIDFTGIIVWLINIPLVYFGYHLLGYKFIIRTIIAVCFQSLLMTVLPSPAAPLFDDPLLNSAIGGAICGYGVGLALREGGSGGGTDILGMICAKKYPCFSVGKISLIINAGVYIFATVKVGLETAAYSTLFSFIAAMIVDRVHAQNVKLTVFAVSRDPGLGKKIMDFTGRGVTSWDGWGEFTGKDQIIHITVINQYEWQLLRRFLLQQDPNVFAFVVSPNMIIGKFERRLEVK